MKNKKRLIDEDQTAMKIKKMIIQHEEEKHRN